MKKDYTKSDDRNFNLSLMASLIVAAVITLLELIEDFISNVKAISWISKLIILSILCIWFLSQWYIWDKHQRNR